MKLFSMLLLFFIGYQNLAHGDQAVTLEPTVAKAKSLIFDENSLKNRSVLFQRGVFRVKPDGDSVEYLCLPVNGIWKKIGSLESCGDSPPELLRREIAPFASDKTILGIRNLGVDTAQWHQIHAKNKKVNKDKGIYYQQIGQAFDYKIGSKDVSWIFDSSKLKNELKQDIPGSGIHVHFGSLLSKENAFYPFQMTNSGVEIETALAVSQFNRSGDAHSGLTLAMDFVLLSQSGKEQFLPVIVNLFNERIQEREVFSSDGRNMFVSSYLGKNNRYVQPIVGTTYTVPFSDFVKFAFRITPSSMRYLIDDENIRRRELNSDLLITDLSKIRLVGVTIRNESRFLNKGDVKIEVNIDYLKVNQ